MAKIIGWCGSCTIGFDLGEVPDMTRAQAEEIFHDRMKALVAEPLCFRFFYVGFGDVQSRAKFKVRGVSVCCKCGAQVDCEPSVLESICEKCAEQP